MSYNSNNNNNNYNYNPNAAYPHHQPDNGPQQAHPHQQFYTPQATTTNHHHHHHQTNLGGPMSMNKAHPMMQQQQQPPMMSGYPPQQQYRVPAFQPNSFFNDPMMTSLAAQYGANLADQGKEYVSKNDWSIKYSQSDDSAAVPPKLDVNAPDMYIPFMAFVTYLLVVGISLGMQKRFTPEILGLQASSALAWFVFEIFVIFVTLQVLGIKSALKTFDIVAFCGYKYFGMIICLLAGIFASKNAYYMVLLYVCVSFTYFMARSLKMLILASHPTDAPSNPYEQLEQSQGNKRRVYVLLFISLIQPLFVWWLTFSLTN